MIPSRSYTRQDRPKVVQRQYPDENSENNLLLSAASEAFSLAAAETMKIMGYNVVAENGWVVKIFANGTKEKIKKIGTTNTNYNIHGQQ